MPAPVPSLPTQRSPGARHLALHPRLPCLYSINETEGMIDVYALQSEPFALTPMQSIDMRPTGARPTVDAQAADLRLTPDGRFLYGNEREHNTITAFAVDAKDGTLARVGSYAAPPGMRCFAVDHRGRFIVGTSPVTGEASVYRIDPLRGGLDAIGVYPAGPGADWVQMMACMNAKRLQ